MADATTPRRPRTWLAALCTSTALVMVAAVQLPSASAQDRPGSAPAPAAVMGPSPAAALHALTLADDPSTTTPLRVAHLSRRAAARATSATVRAAGAVGPTAVRPTRAARAAARPVAAATRPTAAKRPAAARPAAARSAARAARATRPSTTAAMCSGPGWQARRGQAALASLRAGAARTGFSVSFKPARSGYLGLTHLGARRIEMFVRSCDRQSTELLRHVMAHELGHAWDTTRMSPARRAEWQRARGIPAGTPWYGCSGCTDFATPAGDFAEVYAQWARGSATNRSRLAGDPSPAQLRALATRFFGA